MNPEHKPAKRRVLTRAEKDVQWDLDKQARREEEKAWRLERETCRCEKPLLVRKYGLSWFCARCCGWRDPG